MRVKIIPIIALACVLSFLVTGCDKVTDVFDEIVDTDPAKQTSEVSGTGVAVTSEGGKTVDKNLKAPIFEGFKGGSITVAAGTKVSIDATARSTDGGTVSYQWYTNNVNSNGGGTAIKNSTGAVYEPDTSEESVKYYYVVAKNEHETTFIMATSPVFEVKVIKKGEFVTDEFGGVRYLAQDGTYPADMWVDIGDHTYLFNAEGYMVTGWLDYGNGSAYYFDEEGRLLRNTVTPDGYQVDENGLRVGEPAPAAEQPAEQPVEEQPVEEQPAEEQPVEEQPAEEQPAPEEYVEEYYE